MKQAWKIAGIVAVALGALALTFALGFGAARAERLVESVEVPAMGSLMHGGPGGMGGGRHGGGWMADYRDEMHAVIAEGLGISVADLETRLAAGEHLFDIAEAEGVDSTELATIMQEAREAALAAAVADGVITQEQADQVSAAPMGGFGMGGGHRGGGWMAAYRDEMHAIIAEGLGISVADLETRLAAGERLTEIAEAEGLDATELAALRQEARDAALAAAVADGVITQEQADAISAGQPGEFGMGGGRGGHHGGGRRGGMGGWGFSATATPAP